MSLLLSGKLQTLLDRLTATRAGYLDRLNDTITSRQSEANASSRYSTLNGKIDTVDSNVDTILARVPSTVASSSALATTDAVVDNIYARMFGFRAPTRTTQNYSGSECNIYFPLEYESSASLNRHGQQYTNGNITGSNTTILSITGPVVVHAVGFFNSQSVTETGITLTLTIDGNTVSTVSAGSTANYRGLIFNGGIVDTSRNLIVPPIPWVVASSLTLTGYCDDTLGAGLGAFIYYTNV